MGATAGHYGVPVVLVTGDDKAAEEARRFFPGTEAVAVKEGISRNLARCIQPARAREMIGEFMASRPCHACKGSRLRPESRAVTVDSKNIMDVTSFSIGEALDYVSKLKLTSQRQQIAERILKEIRERLGFLVSVGLDYLSLDRQAGSLSGGESQRIRLATQIGSGLVGVP